MRFIRGESLWDAIQSYHRAKARLEASERSLKLRELLNRFVAVCNAVAYAHSRGILHLDLKPGNVMLGRYNETLVVDWGFAKALGRSDPNSGEGTIVPTSVSGDAGSQADRVFGTPHYMSPEHFAGQHGLFVKQSDVYCLGATLYCLLTGRSRFDNLNVIQIREAVRSGNFPPPRKLDPSIDPALEAVCLKAMAVKPEDRYESSQALAGDIERWLADEPVSAWREPLIRLARRWARHHRSLVAGLAGLFAMGIVALAVSFVLVNEQKHQAVLARVESDEHLRLGIGVIEELVRLGDKELISPKDLTETREQLLTQAVRFLGHFRQRRLGDPKLEAESAQVARRLANLYRLRGEFDRAATFYDQAEKLIEDVVARHPRDRDYSDIQAEIFLDAGQSRNMGWQTSEAAELFGRAHDIAEKLAAGTPTTSDYRRTWGRSLYRLASVGLALGRENSLTNAQRAVDQFRPLADAARPGVRSAILNREILPLTDQIELVYAQTLLAEARRQRGQDREAEDELRDALDRMDSLAKELKNERIDDVAYFHAYTGIQFALSVLDGKVGPDEKLQLRLDDAIERLTDLVKRTPSIRHFRVTLGQAHAARARLHEISKRLDQATADANVAREILQALASQYPKVAEHQSDVASVLDTLGRVALARGKREAANRLFEEASNLQRRALEAAPKNPRFLERLAKHQDGMERSRSSAP
jgi:serine/threonine-protein kinase